MHDKDQSNWLTSAPMFGWPRRSVSWGELVRGYSRKIGVEAGGIDLPADAPAWDETDKADYVGRGGGVFRFPEMNFGQMPDDLIAVLDGLGLAWGWRIGSGMSFPEAVLLRNENGREADFHMSECEILLTIAEAHDEATRENARYWQAFWRNTGVLTITDHLGEGGETNTARLD